MGYELYITRAKSWLDSANAPITQSEWDDLVANDPELELSSDGLYVRMVGRRTERFNLVVWKVHPARVPFLLIDGAIEIKNPDQQTVRKMVQIAAKLEARVLGEEGEVYGPDGGHLTGE